MRYLTLIFTLACYLCIPFGARQVSAADLQSDDFSDNSIDPAKWTTAGFRVIEEEQILKIETTVSDQPGNVTTPWIDIALDAILSVERDVTLHYGNNYFGGTFSLNFNDQHHLTLDYFHYYYGACTEDSFILSNVATGVHHLGACEQVVASGASTTPIWDTQFHEKILYNPTTGIAEYFINGEKRMEYDAGILPVLSMNRVQLYQAAYGWWTGHYAHVDNFILSQENEFTNNPPYIPGNPSPTEMQTDVDYLGKLAWSGGDPDPGDSVRYTVYVAQEGSPFTTPVCQALATATCNPGVLAADTDYLWKVVASDSHGETVEGPAWSFTTRAAASSQPLSADWQWEQPYPQGGHLYDVFALSDTEVFAVGLAGTIVHYNGDETVEMQSGVTSHLNAIWGAAANNIFAAGAGGVILHFDGTTWSPMDSGTTDNLKTIWGNSGNDIWIGSDLTLSYVLHYDGTGWTRIPLDTPRRVYGLWGTSESDVYAACNASLLHWDGEGWSVVLTNTDVNFTGIWGSSTTDIYAITTNNRVYHFNGSEWNYEEVTLFRDIWGKSPNEIYALSGSELWKFDGNQWSNQTTSSLFNITAISGSATGKIFGAGACGAMFFYDDGAWVLITDLLTTTGLNGIWGSSSNDIFAVGELGVILHYDGTTWSKMVSPTTSTLYGIWGASASDVFAVGLNGTILHYDGSQWSQMANSDTNALYSVSGSGPDNVYAVGYNHTVLRYTGSGWNLISAQWGLTFHDVWVSSSGKAYCVADSYTCGWGCSYTRRIELFDGANWSYFYSNSSQPMQSIWGSSDEDIYLGSRDMVIHYDGSSWASVPLADLWQAYDVFGLAEDDVYIVGNSIFHFNGIEWARQQRPANSIMTLRGGWIHKGSDAFAVGYTGTMLRQHRTVLQAYIDAAADGDVITVPPGRYRGAGNQNLNFNGKNLELRCGGAPGSCIIEVEGSGRAFDFLSGEGPASIVYGFSVTGGNTSTGGAALIVNSSPTFYNCNFHDNSATYAGGVAIENGAPRFVNCKITGNHAADFGGGVVATTSASPVFQNCTIADNSATNSGGGIHVSLGATATLRNAIVWNNSPSQLTTSGTGEVSITYSLVQGGYGGEANLDTDPYFLGEDYLLSAVSPAVDSGDPAGAPFVDFAGIRRVQGDTVDRGAHEYVPAPWTIQDYIYNAADGDIITIQDGTYQGPGNRELRFDGRGVTLISANGPAQTIIDAEGNGRHFLFNKGEGNDSVISGFTLTGGRFTGAGGSIFISGASPIIENCILSDNKATMYGGAIAAIGGSPVFRNLTLIHNEAPLGGGMFLQAVTAQLDSITFNANVAEQGGGLYGYDATITVLQSDFIDNTAELFGGGIYVTGTGGKLTLVSCNLTGNGSENGGALCSYTIATDIFTCNFRDNSATEYGGAIYLHSETDPAYFTINDSSVFGNSAKNGGGVSMHASGPVALWRSFFTDNLATEFGGGLFVSNSTPAVYSCVLAGNKAYQTGGGIFASNQSSAVLYQSTVADNTALASNGGGGIDVYSTAELITTANIDYSILWHNSPDQIHTWTESWQAIARTSVIEGGWADGIDILDSDPMFLGGTYQLSTYSPCKDKVAATSTMPWDILGNPRPDVALGDIGAYEYYDRPLTIQDYIYGADSGDTVIIPDGLYTGPGNREISFKGKPMTLRSAAGPQHTIIDAEGHGRLFNFIDGEEANTILSGFTLTGGDVNVNAGGYLLGENTGLGGAVFMKNASPTLENCIITGNRADFAGGVYAYLGAPTIRNSVISQNYAGINAGIMVEQSALTLENSAIFQNDGGTGLALERNSDGAVISHVTITSNTENYYGGGLKISSSSPTIQNSIIWGNSPDHITVDSSSSPAITYSIVEGDYSGIGNFADDPLFVENDFHIRSTSPARDQAVGSTAASDIDGESRPQGAISDLGCDEFFEWALDLEGDGRVDLRDVIVGLQVLAGQNPDLDINKFGSEAKLELNTVLQTVLAVQQSSD